MGGKLEFRKMEQNIAHNLLLVVIIHDLPFSFSEYNVTRI